VELRKFTLCAALLIVVILCLVVWFYPPDQDFSTKNPAWNGAKDFYSSFGAAPVKSLGDLPQNPGGTILVEIPYVEISQTDLAALKQYVSDGGTLVLADDYGYGNSVLGYLQVNASFNGAPLLDPLFNYLNSYFPKVTEFAASTITDNITSIVLNHATGITAGAGVNTVARSSAASFLDINNNKVFDEEEPTGPIVVAAQASLSKGSVIMLADPSIMINSMQDIDDNRAFIGNIMNINGNNSEIMLDESHLPKDNLDEAKSGLAVLREKLATPAGITLIVAAIVALALLPILFRGKGGSNGRIFKYKRKSGQDTR
jgi:hypothetical protein